MLTLLPRVRSLLLQRVAKALLDATQGYRQNTAGWVGTS